jgi:hypothetical protein
LAWQATRLLVLLKDSGGMMSLKRANTAISLLEQALEEGFRAYQPFSRATALQGVIARVRMHYPECPLSDYELHLCAGTYAIRHGFNVYDGH